MHYNIYIYKKIDRIIQGEHNSTQTKSNSNIKIKLIQLARDYYKPRFEICLTSS